MPNPETELLAQVVSRLGEIDAHLVAVLSDADLIKARVLELETRMAKMIAEEKALHEHVEDECRCLHRRAEGIASFR